MSTIQNQKKAPGGHYSGTNPIPNIQKFVENLDRDKKDRDRKIDEDAKARKAQGLPKEGEVQDHKNQATKGVPGSRKTVTDPVTGREVQIEDVDADFMKAVDRPQVLTKPSNIPRELSII